MGGDRVFTGVYRTKSGRRTSRQLVDVLDLDDTDHTSSRKKRIKRTTRAPPPRPTLVEGAEGLGVDDDSEMLGPNQNEDDMTLTVEIEQLSENNQLKRRKRKSKASSKTTKNRATDITIEPITNGRSRMKSVQHSAVITTQHMASQDTDVPLMHPAFLDSADVSFENLNTSSSPDGTSIIDLIEF